LSQNLRGMAPRLYRDKGALLQRVATLLEKTYRAGDIPKDRADAFVLTALTPWIESGSSDYFEHTVIPYFRQARQHATVSSLSGFPREERYRRLALALMAETVPLLRQEPSAPLDRFLSALGEALAEARSIAALVETYPPLRPHLHEGIAEMLDGLIAWLQ